MKTIGMSLVAGASAVLLGAYAQGLGAQGLPTAAPFGKTADGQAVQIYTLRNAKGVEARVMTYGGIIVSLRTPDRAGRSEDIVLGFDSLPPYLTNTSYFGAIIGRYGNRIGHHSFTLDGKKYVLPANDGPNTLHGGVRGFDKRVWTAQPCARAHERGVILKYTSADGEEGFPGRLATTVTYTLNDANQLIVDYAATTNKPTPVNLTQHSYFNLKGAGNGTVLEHQAMIAASHFTPVDSVLIPTGRIAPVAGTPFDFRTPTAIGARIDQPDPQLKNGHGYDHNWVLDRKGAGLGLAARVVEPTTGRTLEVRTTEPGVQFYTGNFLDGTVHGKGGKAYVRRGAFCLETQHFPDSPNKPSFPSTILRPGQQYRSRTVFTFGVTR